MGSKFHILLRALEEEHERQLAEFCISSHHFEIGLEKPEVRKTIPAVIHWCGESQDTSTLPVSRMDGDTVSAPNMSAQVSRNSIPKNVECMDGRLDFEVSSTPIRRSSSHQHVARFEDTNKKRIAEQVLSVTSFFDGPGGAACYKKPWFSSFPSQAGWCCLWALYAAHSLYHALRVLALMFASTSHGDDRMAAMLFCTVNITAPAYPFCIFKGKFLSRSRSFAAAISTLLSEAHAMQLLDDLTNAVRIMHIRRLVAIVAWISIELMLLFGPSRTPYRKLALWPWPQTDFTSVLHAVVSSINCTVFFMSDADLIMHTTIKHATLALRNHLEKVPVRRVHEEYDFFCDFLEDYFNLEGSTLKYPFLAFSVCFLILATAFASHPDSHYLPYYIWMVIIYVGVFFKDMITFADQNANIADLAHAVFKRSFCGLAKSDSMEDLHLRLFVAHRRPALVVLGVLELTRPGLIGLISFLLSIAFVIIFEMRA